LFIFCVWFVTISYVLLFFGSPFLFMNHRTSISPWIRRLENNWSNWNDHSTTSSLH
jgi:hypothetical protein